MAKKTGKDFVSDESREIVGWYTRGGKHIPVTKGGNRGTRKSRNPIRELENQEGKDTFGSNVPTPLTDKLRKEKSKKLKDLENPEKSSGNKGTQMFDSYEEAFSVLEDMSSYWGNKMAMGDEVHILRNKKTGKFTIAENPKRAGWEDIEL